jgi:hypothetical protein
MSVQFDYVKWANDKHYRELTIKFEQTRLLPCPFKRPIWRPKVPIAL